MLAESFRRLAHQLRGSLPSSDHLTDALSKGQFREDDLTCAIRPLIPERYRISKGVVFNVEGQQSRPQDLILSDRLVVGEMLSRPTVGLHPIESVVGTIQVKTWATPGEVRSAVENIASVKRLLPKGSVRRGLTPLHDGGQRVWESDHTPFGGIVCFRPKGDPESLADVFHDSCELLDARNRPNGLIVLDSFALFWGELPESGPPHFFLTSDAPDDLLFIDADDQTLPLLQFFTFMLEFLRQYLPPPLDYERYMRATKMQGRARQWVPELDKEGPENVGLA